MAAGTFLPYVPGKGYQLTERTKRRNKEPLDKPSDTGFPTAQNATLHKIDEPAQAAHIFFTDVMLGFLQPIPGPGIAN
ncbi:hypothetical protein V2G26_017783 [Clonostachys chloroleuca]